MKSLDIFFGDKLFSDFMSKFRLELMFLLQSINLFFRVNTTRDFTDLLLVFLSYTSVLYVTLTEFK